VTTGIFTNSKLTLRGKVQKTVKTNLALLVNAVVDIGNTRTKVALFEQKRLYALHEFSSNSRAQEFLQSTPLNHVLVSNVGSQNTVRASLLNLTGRFFELTRELPLPLAVNYETPETLGTDRLAAACGAAARFPRQNCLVIDLGTCINYEWITADNVYQGGAISPGMAMRFKAMHEQTARLPLAEAQTEAPLIGRSTLTCLQSGVMNGIAAELAGIIAGVEKQCTGPLHVILCGGDARVFENQLKPPIFVAPNLVLEGLNSILEHNVAT
jgi:type III pantothenate kinase